MKIDEKIFTEAHEATKRMGEKYFYESEKGYNKAIELYNKEEMQGKVEASHTRGLVRTALINLNYARQFGGAEKNQLDILQEKIDSFLEELNKAEG